MAIGCAIGTPFKSGGAWNTYWSRQPEVLFIGQIKNITGGRLYNEKTGATDYLTVGGTAGSYTFQCPNTAPYIAADTDYIWFKTDASQRTATEAELIGYDLQRTPVKYNDDSPNSIRAIMILSSAVTGSKKNKMFGDFWLSILWDNNLNANGHIKDNRVGQQLWTPETVYDPDLVLFKTGLVTPLSSAYLAILDTFIVGLKSDLSLTNLSDYFDVFYAGASETLETTARNLVKREHDGTIQVTTAPYTWTQWVGVIGNPAKQTYIDTNYNPSTEADNLTSTSNSMGFVSLVNRGAASSYTSWGNATNSRVNPAYTTVAAVRGNLNGGTLTTYDANTTTKICLIMSRTGNNIGSSINGAALNVKVANASAFSNANEYILAYNAAGTASQYDEVAASMYWRSKYSNDADCAKIWARVAAYFVAIGQPLT